MGEDLLNDGGIVDRGKQPHSPCTVTRKQITGGRSSAKTALGCSVSSLVLTRHPGRGAAHSPPDGRPPSSPRPCVRP